MRLIILVIFLFIVKVHSVVDVPEKQKSAEPGVELCHIRTEGVGGGGELMRANMRTRKRPGERSGRRGMKNDVFGAMTQMFTNSGSMAISTAMVWFREAAMMTAGAIIMIAIEVFLKKPPMIVVKIEDPWRNKGGFGQTNWESNNINRYGL